MKFVRTPDTQFENLPDWPYEPKYIQQGDLRMHYVEEGEGETILLLHGEPSWSFLYRKIIKVLAPHYRVIAFDWFGFGRSDKPTEKSTYTYEFHMEAFRGFLSQLNLSDITVVVQDWGGLLGLGMVGEQPDLFKRLVIMNTFIPDGTDEPNKAFKAWRTFSLHSPFFPIGKIIRNATVRSTSKTKEVIAAYDAPFPSSKYKAGARVFPSLVPFSEDDPAIPYMLQARKVLSEWQKPCLVLFSDQDPITGGARRFFAELIPTAEEIEGQRVKDAGHFLQEDAGEEIGGHILDFVRKQ